MSRVAAGLFCLAMSVTSPAMATDLEFGAVEHKVLAGPDEDGDLLVSIKVVVINHADSDQHLALVIQGYDSEEFKVYEEVIKGKVGPKETQAITALIYVNGEIYELISQWKAEP